MPSAMRASERAWSRGRCRSSISQSTSASRATGPSRSDWQRDRMVGRSRLTSVASRMKSCRRLGSSSAFSRTFWVCSFASSARSITTTRRSATIGAPAADASQRRATATMLSPPERASRHALGDPITRSGWLRARPSRQPRHALQGRAPASGSAHIRRASRSSVNAFRSTPRGPWTRSVPPIRPFRTAPTRRSRALDCPSPRKPVRAAVTTGRV